LGAGHNEKVAGGDRREAESVMGWCGRMMVKVMAMSESSDVFFSRLTWYLSAVDPDAKQCQFIFFGMITIGCMYFHGTMF
jgi:hypothetical protein